MNNSLINQYEDTEDENPKLNSEEARLVRIIEAITAIESSKEWSTLKTEVFDNLVNSLDKELRTEAEKADPNSNKLNRIMGKLEWARRYSDLKKFENEKRVELQNIRLKLYGTRE